MKLSTLASLLSLEFLGKDKEISRLNTLANALEDELSYLDHSRYLDVLKSTKAGAVLISKEHTNALPGGCSALVTPTPHLSMAYASAYFATPLASTTGEPARVDPCAQIFPHVYIGKGAVIEADVTIMAGAYIGDNAYIGEGSIIHPNAVIYSGSQLGKRCHILANAVIGADGFGYAHTAQGEHIKIYHTGTVVLEDDVEIGACTTVDRAVFGTTRIKRGTKIDNLVQIAHNCELGEGCIIVSQTGISGSTTLGRNVIMGGQSATSGHLKIGDFATIAARGGVTKSLEGGKTYGGFPLVLQKDWLKLQAKISKFFNTNKENK
ncbi:UDP-3-O-(3-hydroxymyristoyl)glucosamine N-acyltransferase [Sulfurospirillum sp. T05]|uniref:UDP-3-O-acylglucosamine N-acyltransferase n=1 Tax=Sulfurospirillum tamanense TaxID=2813362 RepID=A0ABS2WSF6_9BACT|nr:UDP-3-O-(3-hydroxymyristoyl)glucosamine N-acyltransferase [Sulfurospirillum tamanensis]MBN2964602.1 UDP-3-O-(3-hydroxymyristoyl)glucosamine N-acyltransferase [Sulfurospirillum tamanensis]